MPTTTVRRPCPLAVPFTVLEGGALQEAVRGRVHTLSPDLLEVLVRCDGRQPVEPQDRPALARLRRLGLLAPERMPQRAEDLVVNDLGSEILVYDRRTDRAHCLEGTAAEAFRRCDGRTPVARLAEAMGLLALLLALDELASLGLLHREILPPCTRRDWLKGMAVALPVVATLLAPLPAAAVSEQSNLSFEAFPKPEPEATPGTESYASVEENPFLDPERVPLSTFSVDVDTASWSNIRRFLSDGQLPPPDAVRLEEMLNYFRYSYPQPTGRVPFSLTTELADCPWKAGHRLLRLGLQGRNLQGTPPPRNLVFLLDVSGSMEDAAKLPLLKRCLRALVDTLTESDRVAIVVYAGASGLALPPTSGAAKETILAAIDRLEAGGSTNGGEGIQLAYRVASQSARPRSLNRVILATDGDFNVGLTSPADLDRLIEEKRRSGIFLTVLGFGTGNLKDSTMESLADKGNGNYAYIDTLAEGRKVLVKEAGATLVTLAKDVKLQVEFRPQQVAAYRLLGYENRVMQAEDFADDTKDAGEIGAGHSVTALYQVEPRRGSGDLATVKVRYKEPTGQRSRELSFPVSGAVTEAREDLRFAASVAAAGMLLRRSRYLGDADWSLVLRLAEGALGRDPEGYRKEFLRLAAVASRLQGRGLSGGSVS